MGTATNSSGGLKKVGVNHTLVTGHKMVLKEVSNYLKVITAERQPAHNTIVKHIKRLIIVALNRLQLPVAGTSDGNANTNKAAPLINCGYFIYD